MKISLTKGKYALIDKKDADLAQISWHLNNHCAGHRSGHRGKMIFLQRVIMARQLGRDLLPRERVCTKNRNILDCRRQNLVLCDQSVSVATRGKPANNTSGYKCVFWDKGRQKWRVTIRKHGVKYDLGAYDDLEEAHTQYLIKAKELFGELVNEENI